MATQEDARRAYTESDDREERRAAARERMVAQIRNGLMASESAVGKIYATPRCPWCLTPFDAATWDLDPSLQGQFPLIDVLFGSMAPQVGGGDHEATCPTCGFTAHFQPKKEG